jgi:Uma2 family endonuclease
MPTTAPWTIEQLERLPEDGNRYEVLDGELLVTPAPGDVHEELVTMFRELVAAFVAKHRLGRVYARGVVRAGASQLEPDLVVRPIAALRGWENAPLPLLVVEVLSGSTRVRDTGKKRDFYVASGMPDYWMVDREGQMVVVVRGRFEERVTGILRWSPAGTNEVLEVDVARLFGTLAERIPGD